MDPASSGQSGSDTRRRNKLNFKAMIATYHYRITDFQGGYIPLTARVEVIGETEKSYRVKFLEFGPNGRRPGDTTYVRKKAVRLQGEQAIRPRAIKCRLPYADN